MDIQLAIGFLLTLLPVFELRGGLPIIVEYCLRHGLSVWPYFLVVLVLNIFVILFVFLFLDFLHVILMRWSPYKKLIGKVLLRIQKKVDRIKESSWEYFMLMLFVAVPLPGTGAWTGVLIAWITGLNRLKSFIAIAIGVIIAGILVLLASLGLLSGFY